MKFQVFLVLAAIVSCAFGKILTFSWDNCGSSSSPVLLKSLSISPDPIVLGQNVTGSGSGSIAKTLSSGQLAITLEKSIFGIWTEIPCVDNLGSCTYDDFCDLLTPGNPLCSPPFSDHGFPCKCPIPAGSYSLPPSSIAVPNPNISWLSDGDYYVEVVVSDNSGNQLGCYEIYFSLSAD